MMHRFQATLTRIHDRLRLPRATRSRILLEMADDLEDLYRHYRDEGLDETEAARRAEELVAASDEALDRLLAVHGSGVDRFTERLAAQLADRWQKVFFALLLIFAVLTAGPALLMGGDFLARASLFAWPVLALNAVALGIILAKLYVLLRRPEADPRRLRSGLGTLLFLAVSSVAVGFDGLLIEIFLGLRRFAAGAPAAELGSRLLGMASMMNLAMVTAILLALAWFVLTRWVARLENRAADRLLAAAPPGTQS